MSGKIFSFLIVVAVLVFMLSAGAYASAIGSVETNGKGRVAVEGFGDYIFDRDMKGDTVSRTMTIDINAAPGVHAYVYMGQNCEIHEPAQIEQYYRAGGRLSYGLFENFDVYAILGGASYEMEMRYEGSLQTDLQVPSLGLQLILPGSMRGHVKYDTSDALVWGGGGKVTFDINDDWLAGLDFYYLRHKSKYSALERFYITIDNQPVVIVPPDSYFEGKYYGHFTYQEIKASPYIAVKCGNFVPYVGGSFTWIWLKDEGYNTGEIQFPIPLPGGFLNSIGFERGNRLRYSSRYNIGCFGGFNYKIGDHWVISLEGRFIDETAVSGGVKYRF